MNQSGKISFASSNQIYHYGRGAYSGDSLSFQELPIAFIETCPKNKDS
jgi:hypothetical protein